MNYDIVHCTTGSNPVKITNTVGSQFTVLMNHSVDQKYSWIPVYTQNIRILIHVKT